MSGTDSISIDDALDWFELDSRSIDVEKVKRAYKRLALEHHPDRKYNFKEKSLAHDRFVHTGRARKILEDALRTGRLPKVVVPSELKVSAAGRFGGPNNHTEDARRPATPSWVSEKRFSDHLFDIPVLGGLLAVPLLCGFMFMMAGAVILLVPISLVLGVTGSKGEALLKRLWEMASGLPLIPIYLFLGYVSAVVFGEDNSIVFWFIIICSSSAILLMAIEEIYSMIKFFGKRKVHELTPYNEV